MYCDAGEEGELVYWWAVACDEVGVGLETVEEVEGDLRQGFFEVDLAVLAQLRWQLLCL